MTFTELLAKIFGSTAHKSVQLTSDSGMTFKGYEADEVIDILQAMKADMTDAASWAPHLASTE